MNRILISISLLFSISMVNAQSFQQTSGLANAGPVEGVFVHENIVLASVADRLYRSDDYGDTFSYISVAGEDVTPRCFAMIDDVIILGGINGDRIYRSTDLGLNWESSWAGGPDLFGFSSAVPFTADTLNGEFYMCGTNFIRKSSDLGMSWETMDIDGLCLDISSTSGELWATPGGNLHQSLDEGETWTDVPDDGLFFSNASKDILVSDGRILVATSLAAGNGLYVSDDGGSNYAISGNFSVASTFLKINDNIYFTHLGGFSKSTDNGDTWTTIEGLGGFATYNGDMAYDGGSKIWMASAIGLFWYDISTEEIGSYAFPVGMVNEVTLSTNYLMGIQGGGLFNSEDSGVNWEEITSNLGTGNINVTDVYADGSDIYILAQVEFTPTYFFSSDEGESFESIQLLDNVGYTNQILSFNPVILASNEGVFISNDNGMSFAQADLLFVDQTDAPDNFIASSISQNQNSIFVKGNQGLAYSHDTGTSWTYLAASGVVQFSGWEDRLVRNRSNSFPPYVTEESNDGGATWATIMGLETQFTGPEFMWMMNDTLFIQNDQNAPSAGQIYYLAEESNEWLEAEWYGAIPDQIISAEADLDGRIILGTSGSSAWILTSEVADFITENTDQTFKLYPNPTNDLLFIDNIDEPYSELAIYNSFGAKVITLTEVKKSINVSFLENGIYYLTISGRHGMENLPFIKH